MTRRLVARLDNIGDVVLAGPAVRAVAGDGMVTFLAGPAGRHAARLLPGVERVIVFDAPWVSFDPPRLDSAAVRDLVDRVRRARIDEAVILTSFHQSPLPLAMLLRLAGVPRIAATSVDYPGSLLDVRVQPIDALHEVEQSLHLCAAAGHHLGSDDDASLRLSLPDRRIALPDPPYVVLHPGASVSSRALPLRAAAASIASLTATGIRVLVSGSAGELRMVERLTATGPSGMVTTLPRDTDLAAFAHVIAGASAVVCGNTGPAHLAAAVGTPVVQAFAPVVPRHRWRPWKVDHVQLGRLDRSCGDCSRACTVPGQPCLEPFTSAAVTSAVLQLSTARSRVEVVS